MEVLQWAVGILVVIQMAVMGWFATQLWAHVTECKRLSNEMSYMKADVERMKSDIGTHEAGMRGALHKTAQMCTAHELRLTLLERK